MKEIKRIMKRIFIFILLLSALINGAAYLYYYATTSEISGAEVLSGCSTLGEVKGFNDLKFRYHPNSKSAVYRDSVERFDLLQFIALSVDWENSDLKFDLDGKEVMQLKGCDRGFSIKMINDDTVKITVYFEETFTPDPS